MQDDSEVMDHETSSLTDGGNTDEGGWRSLNYGKRQGSPADGNSRPLKQTKISNYWLAGVPTQNKFSPLTQGNDVPSTSKENTSNVPEEKQLDGLEQQRREPKPPPIFAHDDCPRKERDENVRCVNCGENHPANYKGCAVYKQLHQKLFTKTQHLRQRRTRDEPRQPEMTQQPHQSYADAVRGNPESSQPR
uniref:Uncharacterized protein n=1 Tax=Lutzomyia longipalpis TaxID=7200 RepID=A0A1B0GI14_LUTLO